MAFTLTTSAILLTYIVTSTVECGTVSFWYGPSAYGGTDINGTLAVLGENRGVVNSLMIYCGHSVASGGVLELDEGQMKYCRDTGLVSRLEEMGVGVELVVNSGTSNMKDYRQFFKNGTVFDSLARVGRQLNAIGWNFDLEPQVPLPEYPDHRFSTAADAALYAVFLRSARTALNKYGMRVTAAVAHWTPMISNYELLSHSVDRLMDMQTYNSDSLERWTSTYTYLVNDMIDRTKAGVGLGAWSWATCGDHKCWSTTADSARERLHRVATDGVPEVALFRLEACHVDAQMRTSCKQPEAFWWPALRKFAVDGK